MRGREGTEVWFGDGSDGGGYSVSEHCRTPLGGGSGSEFGCFEACDVISDCAVYEIESVYVFFQAVPPAIYGCVGTCAGCEEFQGALLGYFH